MTNNVEVHMYGRWHYKSNLQQQQQQQDKNQRWAIWREFEPIGPTMLKNPCGAGGLLASYLPSYTKYDM